MIVACDTDGGCSTIFCGLCPLTVRSMGLDSAFYSENSITTSLVQKPVEA